MKYLLLILLVALALTAVAVKVLWSENRDLAAGKAKIEGELSQTKEDLKVSKYNAELMLSESNRMNVSLRRQAEDNQAEAVAAAKIQKDIDYAEDGTKCVDSGPVRRVLDGLWRGSGAAGLVPNDRLQAAGRP